MFQYSEETDPGAMEEPELRFYTSSDPFLSEASDLLSSHTVNSFSKAVVGNGIIGTATITVVSKAILQIRCLDTQLLWGASV